MSKLLAIDYGTKHIGIAISDDKPSVALPFQTINIKTSLEAEREKLIEDLTRLVELEEIGTVLIGMPLKSDGSKTKLGDEIFLFSKDFQEAIDIPVEVLDERFTSKMATQLPYKTSRNIHELSAQILLQEYIDSNY